ncbi:MAG: ATP synthase F1 subunit epsilon [Patescibacteria group bacterium]|jgi:F-type H+-transporting ATPase subunit epsilon|nr:ATP synthase F1 subunit epsilon [bacterium]HQC49787.1 ATP synthase F1 subunit epsilon [bacterium]
MAEKKTIKFEIVTLERVVLKQEILQVTAPTQQGEITVLPDHIPLISILKPGVLEIKTIVGETEIMSVSGGFIEVLKDKVVVLADAAERADELDEEKIAEARKAAEEAKEKAKLEDYYDLSDVAMRLDIEAARDRALRRWRKLKNINPEK